MLQTLYSDSYVTVINKPCGMLVHPTSIAENNTLTALQVVRNQIGIFVYPVHRIDRPTSGIVVFAHTPEYTKIFQEAMTQTECVKQYSACIRGWIMDEMDWDRPVKNHKGVFKEAKTLFKPVANYELPFATNKYETTRISIIQARPETGRWHQIRQHLAQMRHYIINDRVHGDGKQNKNFNLNFGIQHLFLHAHKLRFIHPITQSELLIEAPFPNHWQQMERIIESHRTNTL